MAAFSPDAIRACWTEVQRAIPSAQLSGILAHKPGYHNSRRNNSSGNYSVQRSRDRQGNADAASALDITLNPANMQLLTQRMITATQRRDPRMLRCVRSFFGTVNGRTVTGLDVTDNRWITSDPSHLWHIHVSGYRDVATDRAAWLGLAEILTGRSSGSGGGESGTAPAPTPPPSRGIMTNHRASHAPSQNIALPHGRWTIVRINPNNDVTFVNGPCRAQALVHLGFTGLPVGRAVAVRFFTADVRSGQTDRRVTTYPAVEIIGTAGSTGGQVMQFANIGKPASGWSRRLRCEMAPESGAPNVRCVRTRAETFWV